MTESTAIDNTLAMMHAIDNGATIDRDVLSDALQSHFCLDTAEYGYHDITVATKADATHAHDLRANGGIVITRNHDYDYVNLPIYGVVGILVSKFEDGNLWSLGLSNGDVLY